MRSEIKLNINENKQKRGKKANKNLRSERCTSCTIRNTGYGQKIPGESIGSYNETWRRTRTERIIRMDR